MMQSIARRVSDGRMLGWIKLWLEMAVEEDDGKGGKRRTNRARRERKGTPQGAPLSPLLSNVYMRRFRLGWKRLGYARRHGAEVVNYADDCAPRRRSGGRKPSVQPCCTRDEGRSLGAAVQAEASNHPPLLRLRGVVVSRWEKARR